MSGVRALADERLPPALQWFALGVGLVLLGASIAACIILPPQRFPPTTGFYGVGSTAVPTELVERFQPTSAEHDRPAPLMQLWYPTAPVPRQSWIRQQFLPRDRDPARENAAPSPSPAQFPVILYFSGWPSTQIQNRVLIRELASRGFVVVSLIYPARLPSMTDAQFAQQLAPSA